MWLHLEARGVIGTLDDFETDVEVLCHPLDERTRVLSVRPNLFEAGILGFATVQQLLGSLTVVLVSGRDKNAQNPSVGVYKQMPLASFNLFVRVIADVVLAIAPPVSVVLTD